MEILMILFIYFILIDTQYGFDRLILMLIINM